MGEQSGEEEMEGVVGQLLDIMYERRIQVRNRAKQ